MDYEFKIPPFDHQRKEFFDSRDKEAWALFWEQGTGKSKETIDQISWSFLNGRIKSALILAPNGVHRNWITNEFPKHLPDSLRSKYRGHFYQAGKAKTKWHQGAVEALLKHDGFAVLAMSYDAIMTEAGREVVWKLLNSRPTFYVLDESARIKNPISKRTKRVVASGKYGAIRRILTGTPIANGPFDVYAPIFFLDPTFWKKYGLDSYVVFKKYFGVWQEGYNGSSGQNFDVCVGYRNLEELAEILQGISSRVTKDEVLDLPPKLFSKYYFDMSPEQSKIYREIRDEFMSEIEEGKLVTANLAITRLMRLQQVTSGYLPVSITELQAIPSEDGDEDVFIEVPIGTEFYEIPGGNPRLEAVMEIIEQTPFKAILWARFTQDLDLIESRLKKEKIPFVRYDGSVNEKNRGEAVDRFQNESLEKGGPKLFIGTASAAGEGLTLHAARTVIYYSNSFKLAERLQSEDRAHRIGQEHPVNYIDLVATDTVDEPIIDALVSKLNIANMVLGDRIKEWL